MRQKIIMKRGLAQKNAGQDSSSEQLMSLEILSIKQQKQLAWLLWESFHGSLDDLGETPEEMIQEVTEILAGRYGAFLGKHSYVLKGKENGTFLACGLVSLFRGIPLIIYVSVSPTARGSRLSEKVMKQVMDSLAEEYETVYLVVAEGNTPAEKIYQRLGFEEAGRDWDSVLKEK